MILGMWNGVALVSQSGVGARTIVCAPRHGPRTRHGPRLSLALSPSHTGLTTRLRPTCDRTMLESWANRRKDARLVAEVVGDRQDKISRSKVSTPCSKPVTPGLRPGYGVAATRLVPRMILRSVVGSND